MTLEEMGEMFDFILRPAEDVSWQIFVQLETLLSSDAFLRQIYFKTLQFVTDANENKNPFSEHIMIHSTSQYQECQIVFQVCSITLSEVWLEFSKALV